MAHTLIVLALVVAAITLPLHAIGLRHTRPAAPHTSRHLAPSPARVLRDPGFWIIAAAFILHSAALAVMAVHLVTYLTQLGHPPTVAATLTGLLGLLSVTGRIVTTVAKRWLSITLIAAAIIGLQGVAIAPLPFIGRSSPAPRPAWSSTACKRSPARETAVAFSVRPGTAPAPDSGRGCDRGGAAQFSGAVCGCRSRVGRPHAGGCWCLGSSASGL